MARTTSARASLNQPVKISLAEDPVESYLSSRKPTVEAKPVGTNWVSVLKWMAVAFLVLQVFWWLVPVLARLEFRP